MKKTIFLFLFMSFFCVDAMSAIKVKKNGGVGFSGDSNGVIMGPAIAPDSKAGFSGSSETKSNAFSGSTKTKSSRESEAEPTFDSLQAEIVGLEAMLAEKQAGLEACTQKNQNFKVAGIAALSLTGAGAAGTVYLNMKNKKLIKENDKLMAAADGKSIDTGVIEVLGKSAARIEKAFEKNEDCMKKNGWTRSGYKDLDGDLARLSQKTNSENNKEDVALMNEMKRISDEIYKLLSATEKCEKEE